MKPDSFLLACRIGRWQWPWALFGTVLTITLVLAIGLVTGPMETKLAALYGAKPSQSVELVPGRIDTFASFLFFAISISLAPALVMAAVHRLEPQTPLGPDGRFDWSHVIRGAAAVLLVMTIDAAVSIYRDQRAFQFVEHAPVHYLWMLAALPLILFQSFSEEYLFKGYFARTWGAVLPLRWPIVFLVCALFTAGHSINEDVAKDLIFNLTFFFLSELVTLIVFFRTESLAGVTGLHWANNVWVMLLMATEPGQSQALSLSVYKDPIWSAGRSRLTDVFSWCEALGIVSAILLLLTWRYSPLRLPSVLRDAPKPHLSEGSPPPT